MAKSTHIRSARQSPPNPRGNVHNADVDDRALERAKGHGHSTEHITVPNDEVWQHGGDLFARKAIAQRRASADEILQISKSFTGVRLEVVDRAAPTLNRARARIQ